MLWLEAVQLAVVEGRLDLAGGLELLPRERREQWATWISDATGADPGQFTPNGFTVTALQAAWSAITSTPVPELAPARGSFPCQHLQDALHSAIRVGDDTDTVAAIAGGLLGARWGASAIPASWRRIVHGWPGLRARDLVRLGVLTARHGRDDSQGRPTAARVAYAERTRPAVAVPGVDGVWLGGIDATGHPGDAVVSLCRLGADQPQVRAARTEDQVEVWLIDSGDPAQNPNLHFVIDDAARTVLAMRGEGRQVLLHCVAMHHRTPSVAARVGVLAGATYEESRRAVLTALPMRVGPVRSGTPSPSLEIIDELDRGAGLVTGALCVLLVVRRSSWNFPVGIANNVVFIVLFVGAGLYADAGLQVVYIVLGIVGWLWWLRGRSDDATLVVRQGDARVRSAAVAAVVMITLALHWALNTYTDSTVAVWDALTAALSLVAQWLLNARYVENWLLWVVADVLYVGLFLSKGLSLTAAVYLLFLGLCAAGLRSWRAALKRQPVARDQSPMKVTS